MRVGSFTPPVMMPRGSVGVNKKRSALPIDPLLTRCSPFELATLLAKLRQQPELREELIREVIQRRKTGVYFTRQTAELTAQAIMNLLPSKQEMETKRVSFTA